MKATGFTLGAVMVTSMLTTTSVSGAERVESPDGRVAVAVDDVVEGVPTYQVLLDGQEILAPSRLGLVREDQDFSTGLTLLSASPVEQVSDTYELRTIKRRHNNYTANRRTFRLANTDGSAMDVIFQVSNDGVAFRYHFPASESANASETLTISTEATTFKFPTGTKAWLQPMAVPKTGFAKTNPSYEEYYQQEIDVGTPSTMGMGWVFPALFRTGETWVLISEAGLGRTYCGTRLSHESPDGEYRIAFPDAREGIEGQPVNPTSTLPWLTPWRVIVVGDLATIAESTLGTDVADPPAVEMDVEPRPGRASWSWPLLGDGKTEYDTQKRFIDYAADMGWEYCLIDALWDRQIGYERVKELADYAATKNVSLLLWYNSNGHWNDAPQSPKDRMHTHEARNEEFARIKAMGIKGVKVDFFGGDGQSMINLYHDILVDAAEHGILVNFHGATIPRGWQRTYPNLMTMESIRGLEFITFYQGAADAAPSHMAMLPFARNVFDPMDFTPVALDRINDRVQRRTSSGFELATAILFTSGIQHYAEIPEGMAKMPEYVVQAMRDIPAEWDDVKLLDGFPSKYVLLARRSGDAWYVAGVNADETERMLEFDPHELGLSGMIATIEDDGGPTRFRQREVPATETIRVRLAPRGGFIAIGHR